MSYAKIIGALTTFLTLTIPTLGQDFPLTAWTDPNVQEYICKTLTDDQERTNAAGSLGFGRLIQSMEVEIDCNLKRYSMAVVVTQSMMDLPPDAIPHALTSIARLICARPGWGRIFELGWSLKASIFFKGKLIRSGSELRNCPP
ncbi:hypothetical protein [Devosia sp.]|uniref:hypothetical protein n=1 Tax=Devosia sp. TaxID=1871048 RepID=UPI002635E09E|nr:hypothetical protein [Devosia sp.]